MSARTSRISTTVRSSLHLLTVRLAFRAGGVFNPRTTLRAAGELFSTPFRSSRERALQSPLGDAVCDSFELDGHRIATYRWGDPARQPYVLFAHGWSSHGTRFLDWVPRLREAGYAVVAFDQPAHGRSSGRRATLPMFAEAAAPSRRRRSPSCRPTAWSASTTPTTACTWAWWR